MWLRKASSIRRETCANKKSVRNSCRRIVKSTAGAIVELWLCARARRIPRKSQEKTTRNDGSSWCIIGKVSVLSCSLWLTRPRGRRRRRTKYTSHPRPGPTRSPHPLERRSSLVQRTWKVVIVVFSVQVVVEVLRVKAQLLAAAATRSCKQLCCCCSCSFSSSSSSSSWKCGENGWEHDDEEPLRVERACRSGAFYLAQKAARLPAHKRSLRSLLSGTRHFLPFLRKFLFLLSYEFFMPTGYTVPLCGSRYFCLLLRFLLIMFVCAWVYDLICFCFQRAYFWWAHEKR